MNKLPFSMKLQLVLFLVTLILFVLSFFYNYLSGALMISAGLTLCVMAYTSNVQGKKHLAIVDIIFAIIMFLSGIGEYING